MDRHTPMNEWKRLSNGFDVEFRHGIPYRVSDNGIESPVPAARLLEEIVELGKLQVQLGDWESGEQPTEHEARLYVEEQEFARVLERLAQAAAAVFIDRFNKPIDTSDIDWDRLEYLSDFNAALDHCGVDGERIDPDTYRAAYLDTMHRESQRLAQTTEPPMVEPE